MLESENISKYFGRALPYTIKSSIFLLAAKEVPLYGGRDKRVVKYGYSFDIRSHGKITSP
jgi:hypothetical protein